jgi:hypothetical protein
MDISNSCTKVKSMELRFLTLVEKKATQVSKPYYLILRRFNLKDSFCKSLKNNNGVRKSKIRKNIKTLKRSYRNFLSKKFGDNPVQFV